MNPAKMYRCVAYRKLLTFKIFSLVPNGFQFEDYHLFAENPNYKCNTGKPREVCKIHVHRSGHSSVVSSSSNMQSLLDPFSKLLSFVIQYGMFSLSYLIELCGLCYKAFNKVLASVFT